MNPKRMIKISNIIGMISIILLIYWVFVFMAIEVFDLKVFQSNITTALGMSIMGILALMFGALMINIMFNLTRIADRHNEDALYENKKIGKIVFAFFLSFPLIFALLWSGDYLTKAKKEKLLIASAEEIIAKNPERIDALLNYHFDVQWVLGTNRILHDLSAVDTHFPHISVIVKDKEDGHDYFLGFSSYTSMDTLQNEEKRLHEKTKYIRSTTQEEREYLGTVFSGNEKVLRFSAKDGRYELFYPVIKDGQLIVLFFSDNMRYGTMGSS